MSSSFDFATLYFCAMVVAVSATLAMFFVWRIHGREPAVRYWALGYLACAISTALFSLPAVFPVILAKSFGNLVALSSIVLIYLGTARFLHKAPDWRWLVVIYGPAGLANLYLSLWIDALLPRLLVFATATAAGCLLMVRDLWFREAGPEKTVFRFVGACWVLYGIATLARPLLLLGAGPGLQMTQLGLPQTMWFAVLQSVLILTVVGHLLMASQRLQLRLDELASLDELTGVYNRRAFLAAFNQQHRNRRAAPKTSSAVLVLDLDHFKQINDRYGHAGGDLVLRETAMLVRASLRDFDVFARAGGEEFWLLLPGVDAAVASAVAERLRKSVEGRIFHFEGVEIRATVSIGIALLAEGDAESDINAALAEADRALYAAKSGGRNRFEIDAQQ